MEFKSSFFQIREWGEPETPCLPTLSRNDGSLVLHDEEEVLERQTCGVALDFYNIGPDGKPIEKQFVTNWSERLDVTVTSERIAYVWHDYAKGNAYVAPDGLGLVMTAISKRRAKARAAGTAYVGQIPFTWPLRVCITEVRVPLRGIRRSVTVPFGDKKTFFRLWLHLDESEIERWVQMLAHAISKHRLAKPSITQASPEIRQQLEDPTPNEKGTYELPWWEHLRI